MRIAVAILFWFILMQAAFDAMVLNSIVHGEAAWRIVTYRGALAQ